ncbi:uncharacterized protein LOC107490145 [Arachis duranensis]|uniref:Uncharacterized protein LOC107490145 n=1 Tax=Arachis duranensis TaxID=130453 RepID=A0A6P4DDH6_ARADU|nr:uncharacterized protein LOC107490145 [Arachis duranensis]
MEITGLSNASDDFVPLVGENYAMKMKNSVQELISETRKGSPDFSSFLDVFYELMQANVNPPFEVIWVYTAIKFQSLKSEKGDALDRVSDVRSLFQLLSACSASVGASKSVALMAPVVYEVHKVLLELSGKELKLKREKKAMKEVKSLVDVIVGYMSICCSKKVSEEEEHDFIGLNLIMPFTDLAYVWMNANGDADNGFESLLPILGSDVCKWLCDKGFHVGYLGGAVIMEAFFLKLRLLCHRKTPGDELEVNLKSWAVGSISSFQNIYFLEVLMRAALGTSLPLSSISKSEEETLFRKVLFDALLLVEYPFLYENSKYIKDLSLTRLIVTHKAVEYFRGIGDQKRALSYVREFSVSRIPLQIIKYVTSQNGLEEKAVKANGSSPRALLTWLLSIENRGIRVLEDDTLRSCAKSGLDISQAEQPTGNLNGKMVDDDLFYVDNVGEEGNAVEEDKQNEVISDAFVAAARTMKVTDGGSQKRKGKSKERKVKFIKHNLLQNSRPVKAETSSANDGSSGESEVEDPASDSDS